MSTTPGAPFTPRNHAGLATAARPAVLARLLQAGFDVESLTVADYPGNATAHPEGWELADVYVPARGWAAVPNVPATVRRSLLERPLRGAQAPVDVVDSLIAHVVGGVGLHLRGCHIGSTPLPAGRWRRPSTDGAQPCLAGGQARPATSRRSRLIDCDIVNTHGRYSSGGVLAHMDGVQVWDTGNFDVIGCRIDGWWQSAIMLKSDRGPIDDVLVHGNVLDGAQWFQVRIIDGGHGRPRNVTLTQNVLHPAGGRSPVNTGDDRCSTSSQTRYVRTEALRMRPEWVVFAENVTPDGVEVEPPGGWFDPGPITVQPSTSTGGTP